MDAPATQTRKRDCLNQIGEPRPENLFFVAMDFTSEGLAEVLRNAGFDQRQPSLFLLEGVSMYLEAEAVDRLLAALRAIGADGSLLAFDYAYRSAIDGRRDRYGAAETRARTIDHGEPFQFGIPDNTSASYLAERGFELVPP